VQLTGGRSNNTIVVNDSDNTIYVDQARNTQVFAQWFSKNGK